MKSENIDALVLRRLQKSFGLSSSHLESLVNEWSSTPANRSFLYECWWEHRCRNTDWNHSIQHYMKIPQAQRSSPLVQIAFGLGMFQRGRWDIVLSNPSLCGWNSSVLLKCMTGNTTGNYWKVALDFARRNAVGKASSVLSPHVTASILTCMLQHSSQGWIHGLRFAQHSLFDPEHPKDDIKKEILRHALQIHFPNNDETKQRWKEYVSAYGPQCCESVIPWEHALRLLPSSTSLEKALLDNPVLSQRWDWALRYVQNHNLRITYHMARVLLLQLHRSHQHLPVALIQHSQWLSALAPLAVYLQGPSWVLAINAFVKYSPKHSLEYVLQLMDAFESAGATNPHHHLIIQKLTVHLFKTFQTSLEVQRWLPHVVHKSLIPKLQSQWMFVCTLFYKLNSNLKGLKNVENLVQSTARSVCGHSLRYSSRHPIWNCALALSHLYREKSMHDKRIHDICSEMILIETVTNTAPELWMNAIRLIQSHMHHASLGSSSSQNIRTNRTFWKWVHRSIPSDDIVYSVLHSLIPGESHLKREVQLWRALSSPRWEDAVMSLGKDFDCEDQSSLVVTPQLIISVLATMRPDAAQFAAEVMIPKLAAVSKQTFSQEGKSEQSEDLNQIIEYLAKNAVVFGSADVVWKQALHCAVSFFPTHFDYIASPDLKQILYSMARRKRLTDVQKMLTSATTPPVVSEMPNNDWNSAVVKFVEVLGSTRLSKADIASKGVELIDVPGLPCHLTYLVALHILHASGSLSQRVLTRLIFATLDVEEESVLQLCSDTVEQMARMYVDFDTRKRIHNLLQVLNRKQGTQKTLSKVTMKGELSTPRIQKKRTRFLHKEVFEDLARVTYEVGPTAPTLTLPLLYRDVKPQHIETLSSMIINRTPESTTLYATHGITPKHLAWVLSAYLDGKEEGPGSLVYIRKFRNALCTTGKALHEKLQKHKSDVVTTLCTRVLSRNEEGGGERAEGAAAEAQVRGAIKWSDALRYVFRGDSGAWRRALSTAQLRK
eukprot:PhF_6_TR34940/c0_g1_i1/m.50661